MIAWHLNDKSQIESRARAEAGAEAAKAAQKINQELRKLADIGTTLAGDLTSGQLADNGVEERLLNELAQNRQESCPED